MRHTLEHSAGKGREGGEGEQGLAIVRRHLVASFVYTILDIGQVGIGSGRKGNGHQHEICKAQHALKKRREKKRISSRKFMQATNSKHMSCQRERVREREAADIRGSNQLFIYCLLLVCFSFHCVSFRVISHCEGRDHTTLCAPSHSDCHDLSHGTNR